jgi:hypothetical protein
MNISKQKSAIQKHNVVMKTQQKEMQTVTLERGRLRVLLYPRVFTHMGIEQLEMDLATSEQAVVDIKASSGAMHQELQDQYTKRDEITVRITGDTTLRTRVLTPLPTRRSWREQRHYTRRNLPI